MDIEAKELSCWDTVRFFLAVVIPGLLRGSLAPSRFWLPILVRLNAGQWSADMLDALRRKHKSDLFRVRFIFKRTLLVLDPECVDAVFQSADNQADPPLKKKAFGNFIPAAVIISSDAKWRDRRNFNEQALDYGKPVHRHAAAFVDIISTEVGRLPADSSGVEMRWPDFRKLAQKISQQVLLGAVRPEPDLAPPELATEVDHLVARVNWHPLPICLRHPSYFSSFYKKIEDALRLSLPSHCLIGDSAKRFENKSANDVTQVPRQIGFWVFVLRDALELHVARTLALVAAHPQVQDKVRLDLQSDSTPAAGTVAGLENLESCIREQLRLWSPAPILLRRATKPFSLPGDIPIEIDQQIMLYPGYYHRDPNVFGHLANQFSPDSVSPRLPPIYYFSEGRQQCAGKDLALFLIKATLASLLARFRFELIGPPLDTDRIPDLYDHFHVRFRATPERPSHSRSTGSGEAAQPSTPACHA